MASFLSNLFNFRSNQVQNQISREVAQQSMIQDYYLVEAFENVIKAFRLYTNAPNLKEKATRKIGLNLAIDNCNVQFQICKQNYPTLNKAELDDYMKKV